MFYDVTRTSLAEQPWMLITRSSQRICPESIVVMFQDGVSARLQNVVSVDADKRSENFGSKRSQ